MNHDYKMKWTSHIAIATAIQIPLNPLYIPVAAAGATAPDWLESILKILGIKVAHRTITHQLLNILILVIFGIAIFRYFQAPFYFALGAFTHWLADSLTRTGVPISHWSKHNTTLFGGVLRTGEFKEYILAFSFLAFSLFLFKPNLLDIKNEIELKFNAYLINYRELYELQIIDQKELKENRFKLF